MKTLLAIESSGDNCSVALFNGADIFQRQALGVKKHAELILPFIDELLNESGVGKNALQAIAYGRGPGAFTGVRLAVSVAQGLCFALDIPAIGVSTLAAVALQSFAQHPISQVLASIDARMGEIYLARYRRDEQIGARLLGQELLLTPTQLRLQAGEYIAGNGAQAHASHFAEQQLIAAAPHARYVGELARLVAQQTSFTTEAIPMPVYLRDKVAQTTSERQRYNEQKLAQQKLAGAA